LGRPAFPVDTHIHRVAKRLGLISQKASREAAHEVLGDLLPPDTYYSFHLNVITHGREVCHARNPEHERCVLQDLCDTYQDLTA
jgi:endonuclease-3